MGRVHWRHRALERRMRRNCYYSNGRPLDRLSLPLTEAVVEYFTKNAPFGDLDFQYACDVSYAGAVSPSMLIVAMIYLERMRLNKKDQFESSDPADLFASALLCASKFLYDEAETEFVYNNEWALSCSRTLKHVNKAEVEFLKALDWNIMARERDFYEMMQNLEINLARKQSRWRGFATYSELSVLASSMSEIWTEILMPALTMIGIATLTYTATVAGLYTCSLYAKTMNAPRASPSPLASLSPSSIPVAQQTPLLPPPVLNVAFEPAMELATNQAEPAVQTKMSPPVAKSSSNLSNNLPDVNRNNASLCRKEILAEETISLPSPWTSWFYIGNLGIRTV